MKKDDEIRIVEQVKQGDLLAFRLLVDMHKTLAFNIALQIVRNREDAEEIAQDAFLKAYQNIHTFKGESKFSTWFYRIVFNLAVSKTRKKKIETSNIDDVQITDKEISDAFEAFNTLDREDKELQLRNAVDNLKEDESLVITLFYLNENSIDEISSITGFSIPNVKVKLHRARKNLFSKLSKETNVKAQA